MPSLTSTTFLIVLLLSSPVLGVDYSTFLGGMDHDAAYSVLINDQDGVLIAGLTRSDNFPVTAGVYGGAYAGGDSDVFVLHLTSDLSAVVASTYIGGSDHDGLDFVYHPRYQMDSAGPAMAFDADGNLLVTGSTLSLDFPTTAGAYDTVHNTFFEDAFLLRLSPDLSTLMQATLFGGEHKDMGKTLWVEPAGSIVVGGDTRSQGFPVTAGAYGTTYYGGERDVFLIRFTGDLSAVTEATYFGGEVNDYNRALLRDANGAFYTTGWTTSEDLPSTPGAYDEAHNGGSRDVYIARLSSDFSSLEACTYLGGHDWGEPFHGGTHEGGCDEADGMIFDTEGNLVVVGTTHSHDFPITAGAFDPQFNDGTEQAYDGFLAVMTADLTTLLHSSYLGGRRIDELYSVALDANGDLVVAGGSGSFDFPVTPNAADGDFSGEMEGVVVRISADLSTLFYATFMGGSDFDQAYDLALDSSGLAVAACGYTFSDDFQHFGAGYDQTHNGDCDAFAFRSELGHSAVQTLDADLTATPDASTLPFYSAMCGSITNATLFPRSAVGRLNVSVPGGQYFGNYRGGFTNLGPVETYQRCWPQWFPDLPTLDGVTLFELVVQDVTSAPYNQPPYPPSGSVTTAICTVNAWQP